jgi:hypothetical protein
VSYWTTIRWMLRIQKPLDLGPQLGVLFRVWPDERYTNVIDGKPPPTDEELVMDAVERTVLHIAATGRKFQKPAPAAEGADHADLP